MNKEKFNIQDWLGNNQLGQDIVNRKYLQTNETFEQWINRISAGNEELKSLILDKKFLPGGRILSNRGLDNKGIKSTLSNCYVLSVDDSIESIYQCCANMARTYSYGGGVGIDISKLRPEGAVVHNSARSTTGAVSFMKTFDVVTGTIGQNGRRGALMISIDVNHPDLPSFIDIKANTDQITNANISIRVNDEFMRSVKNDEDYMLRWPCDVDAELSQFEDLEYGKMISIETQCGPVYVKKVKARELFKKISENNWNFGEPGVLYWDRIVNYNLMSENEDFSYAGVNPCAEEPLPDGGACLLGSMNLYEYAKDGYFDYDTFAKDVKTATIALNDIQVEGTPLHPLSIQKETAKKYKQIGLGIFDLAGALIKMHVVYGSGEAQMVADRITHTMLVAAFEQSCDLNVNNTPYDGLFDSKFYNDRILPFIDKKYIGKYPLNSQLLTIAPTGTISTMLNATSGGGEPMFGLYYTRETKSINDGDEKRLYVVMPQVVLDYFKDNNIEFDPYNTDPSYINEKIECLPDYFIPSDKITPKQRIEMQAALQKNIDASISSTINLPESATIQDISDIYMYAWECGLKGVTVFRSGCKREAILTQGIKQVTPVEPIFNTVNAPKRPKTLPADYYQVKVQGENFIIIVGLLDDKPYELFAMPCDNCQKVKNHRGTVTRVKKRVYKFESDVIEIPNIAIELDKEYDINGEIDKISSIVNVGHQLKDFEVDVIKESVYHIKEWCEKREYRNVALHVSGNLRTGMRIEDIIRLEEKCGDSIVSFPKAISRVLGKYAKEESTDGETCPECGSLLINEGGCKHCPNCGYSKCG